MLDPLLEHRQGVGPPGTVCVEEDGVAVRAHAYVVVEAVVRQGGPVRGVAPADAAAAVAAVVPAGEEPEALFLVFVWLGGMWICGFREVLSTVALGLRAPCRAKPQTHP